MTILWEYVHPSGRTMLTSNQDNSSPWAFAPPTSLSANENPACKPLHILSMVVGAGEMEQVPEVVMLASRVTNCWNVVGPSFLFGHSYLPCRGAHAQAAFV